VVALGVRVDKLDDGFDNGFDEEFDGKSGDGVV